MDIFQQLGLSPAFILAAGTALALFTKGWQHVVSLYHYFSSFLVTRVRLERREVCFIVVRYLLLNFKCYGSNNHLYATEYLEVDKPNNWMPVLFKKNTSDLIFIRGREIILVSGEYSSIEIKAIRGLVDIEKIVVEAIRDAEDKSTNNVQKSGRYKIHRVMGADKSGSSDWERFRKQTEDGETKLKDSENPIQDSPPLKTVFKDIDSSFTHDKHRYMNIAFNDDPFSSLFYPKDIEEIKTRVDRWFKRKEWYQAKNLPWRLGCLFHGPGGTGKSEMAKALAKYLDIPIYQFYVATLSDQEFVKYWENMERPCIALLEDFDSVFHGRENQTVHKALSFDCILNQISGVGAKDGTLLLMTTNNIQHIDPALGVVSEFGTVSSRPGRIDIVQYFGFIKKEERQRMASHILSDWPEARDRLLLKYETEEHLVAVQFQELCVQLALELIAEQEFKNAPNN